jgi:hypothetical protein
MEKRKTREDLLKNEAEKVIRIVFPMTKEDTKQIMANYHIFGKSYLFYAGDKSFTKYYKDFLKTHNKF